MNIETGEETPWLLKDLRIARDIPGVLRIALIGSLTTDKESPKDIDVLVTVSDDCDLTALAQLAMDEER